MAGEVAPPNIGYSSGNTNNFFQQHKVPIIVGGGIFFALVIGIVYYKYSQNSSTNPQNNLTTSDSGVQAQLDTQQAELGNLYDWIAQQKSGIGTTVSGGGPIKPPTPAPPGVSPGKKPPVKNPSPGRKKPKPPSRPGGPIPAPGMNGYTVAHLSKAQAMGVRNWLHRGAKPGHLTHLKAKGNPHHQNYKVGHLTLTERNEIQRALKGTG